MAESEDWSVMCVMVTLVIVLFGIFFFKQKTAYEMRISDWSSDVCSSDLHALRQRQRQQAKAAEHGDQVVGGIARWLEDGDDALRAQLAHQVDRKSVV